MICVSSCLERGKPVCRELAKVLRRRANPAFTVRQSMASDCTVTGGFSRVMHRITAEVTLGMGRKQVLGTVNSSSGSV